jgi:hypothetical protein
MSRHRPDEVRAGQFPARISAWRWVIGIVLAVLFVGMSIVGFLAYTGEFRDASVVRVVRIDPDGDVCVRSESGSAAVTCIDGGHVPDVEVGDCLSVYFGEGVTVEGRADCPR